MNSRWPLITDGSETGVPLHQLGLETLPTTLTQFSRQVDAVDQGVSVAVSMLFLGAMCESWM